MEGAPSCHWPNPEVNGKKSCGDLAGQIVADRVSIFPWRSSRFSCVEPEASKPALWYHNAYPAIELQEKICVDLRRDRHSRIIAYGRKPSHTPPG